MPNLLIDCPITGKPVFTGKTVPKTMPADHLIGNVLSCTECGKVHKWEGRDAYYLDHDGKRMYLK